jgi:hypothetical protein
VLAGATVLSSAEAAPKAPSPRPAAAAPSGSAETADEAPSEGPDLENDPILNAEPPPAPPVAPAGSAVGSAASPGARSEPPVEGTPALVVPAAITGGLGALGLVMFAVFGGLSQSTYGDLEAECRDGHCPPEMAEDAATARAQQAIANTAVVCGATLLVAGGVLFTFSQWDVASWFGAGGDEGAAASASLSFGVGSVQVRGRF